MNVLCVPCFFVNEKRCVLFQVTFCVDTFCLTCEPFSATKNGRFDVDRADTAKRAVLVGTTYTIDLELLDESELEWHDNVAFLSCSLNLSKFKRVAKKRYFEKNEMFRDNVGILALDVDKYHSQQYVELTNSKILTLSLSAKTCIELARNRRVWRQRPVSMIVENNSLRVADDDVCRDVKVVSWSNFCVGEVVVPDLINEFVVFVRRLHKRTPNIFTKEKLQALQERMKFWSIAGDIDTLLGDD